MKLAATFVARLVHLGARRFRNHSRPEEPSTLGAEAAVFKVGQ